MLADNMDAVIAVPFVRFGVKAVNANTSHTDYKSAVVSLRIDWRNP
jgi:hypothetical protein